MAAYVPSGRVGAGGALMLVAIGAVAAAALGVGVHYLGRIVYLVLIFPLVWGGLIGGAIHGGVHAGKCRSAAVAAVVAALMGALSYATYHGLENRRTRAELVEATRAMQEERMDDAEAERVVDEFLRETYGSAVRGLLEIRAQAGMTISSSGRSGSSRPMITGVGMYVYWLVELAAIAVVALIIPIGAARKTFCETCEEWYASHAVARLADARTSEAIEAIGRRDFAGAGACAAADGGSALSIETCPACEIADVRLRVERVTHDEKGNEKRETVHDDMLPAADGKSLREAFEPGKPA